MPLPKLMDMNGLLKAFRGILAKDISGGWNPLLSQILSPVYDAREDQWEPLAFTAGVNLNISLPTMATLYTVPEGYECRLLNIAKRVSSAGMTGAGVAVANTNMSTPVFCLLTQWTTATSWIWTGDVHLKAGDKVVASGSSNPSDTGVEFACLMKIRKVS